MTVPPALSSAFFGATAADIIRRLADHPRREIPRDGLLPAAVTVPLVATASGLAVLLTRRSDEVEHHKGEICFPGGRVDPGDADSLAAALRETREEVGIRPTHLRVLGRLDDFVSISGFRVRPHVVLLDQKDYPFTPEPREVDEILLIPLVHLQNPAHHEIDSAAVGDRLRHRFHWHGQLVWGLTASILDHFLNVALPAGDRP